MKILMPVIQHKGKNVKLDDDVILSGVELFQKLVYQNIDGVIPVYISFEDRMKKNTSSIIQDAVFLHRPDIIFTNHFSKTYTVGFQKFDVPVVWLNHSPGIRSLYNVESVRAMHEFSKNHGSIYHVSKHQFDQLNAISNRILKKDIPGMHGYINPAFATGNEHVSETKLYDAVTVGRTDVTKNPFFLHKKLDKSSLTSLVLTSTPLFDCPNQVSYGEKNSHWKSPRTVLRDLPHHEVMTNLAKGAVYVSTCQVESWGITALEALSRGLPLVLVTDSSGTHASQTIADSENDYRLVRSGIKSSEFEAVISELCNLSHADRVDIAQRTQRKHNKDAWCDALNAMFNDSVDRYHQAKHIEETESLFKFT